MGRGSALCVWVHVEGVREGSLVVVQISPDIDCTRLSMDIDL